MNLHRLVIELSKASKKTKNPSFGYYPRHIQENIVKDAQKGLNIDPVQKFDPNSKELRLAIANTIKNNRDKYSKQVEAYKNPKYLEKIADNILTRKVEKTADYTLENPEDYTYNRSGINKSKFVDDEGNSLPEDSALDNVLYNENIESLYIQPKEKTAMEQALLDAIRVKNFGNRRTESKWLEKQLQNFADDAAIRDPSTLPYYSYNIKDPITKQAKYEDIYTPTRLESLRQMYKNYHDIDNVPVESPWKNLQDPTKLPGGASIYSKDITNESFDPYTKTATHPLNYLSKQELDKIKIPRKLSEEEALQNKLSRNQKLNNFVKDYYRQDDSRIVNIDPQTGDIITPQEKAEQWVKYIDAPDTLDDVINKFDSYTNTSYIDFSDLYDHLDDTGRAIDKYGDYIPQDKLEESIINKICQDILDDIDSVNSDDELEYLQDYLQDFDFNMSKFR